MEEAKKMEEILKTGSAEDIFMKFISGNIFEHDDDPDLLSTIKSIFEVTRMRGLSLEKDSSLGSDILMCFEWSYTDGKCNEEIEFNGVKLLLDAGMDPNILCYYRDTIGWTRTSEPIPLLLLVIKFKHYNLMDLLFTHPNLIVTAEMLKYINEIYEPIDRCREMMIARVKGNEGSRKRTRYTLDDME